MTLLPRYIRNLGFASGLLTFLKVEFVRLEKFRLPPYKGHLYLRARTSDIKVFREIFLFKTYAMKLSESPEVIVDAGANIGLSSVFFAHRFPDASIYSVEPEQSNFLQLQKNTASYPNVKPVRAALWHCDALLGITDPQEHHWAFTVKEVGAETPASFDGISLRSFMLENGLERIDLLKIDIEGAEHELFSEGYDYWLPRTKAIIIELHDWLREGCSATFFKAISRYPIKMFVYEGMLVIELNH